MPPLRISALLALAGLGVACSSKPLPDDKLAYAGHWTGKGVDLTLTEGGHCSYHRVSDDGSVDVDAPVQRFDGDDFVVGLAFFNTTFDVTAPPHQQDGRWHMTVDGHELVRIDAP